MSYIYVKSPQLIWRWGARRCVWTIWEDTEIIATAMAARRHSPLGWSWYLKYTRQLSPWSYLHISHLSSCIVVMGNIAASYDSVGRNYTLRLYFTTRLHWYDGLSIVVYHIQHSNTKMHQEHRRGEETIEIIVVDKERRLMLYGKTLSKCC